MSSKNISKTYNDLFLGQSRIDRCWRFVFWIIWTGFKKSLFQRLLAFKEIYFQSIIQSMNNVSDIKIQSISLPIDFINLQICCKGYYF